MQRIRRHLGYANVVSTLCLFILLGGVGYAASKIGTSDLENGAVTAKKLHKKAVTTKKIKNHAVTDAKLAAASRARAFAFIDFSGCTASPHSCTIRRAKNVLGANRPQNGFICVDTGPGINPATSGFMAGVEWQQTAGAPGNASAMPSIDPPPTAGQVCPGEFAVATERINTSTNTPNLVNDVAIWFAVP
jgi:hypothetical protein